MRADERERQVGLGRELLQHRAHALLAADGETVRVGTAEEHRVGAERERLDDVGASADAAVDEQRKVDRRAHLLERVERRDRAVDLAAAVVRDDDAVDLRRDRAPRVLRGEHALHEQRQRGLRAKPREVGPREPQVRKGREHRRRGGERVFGRRLLEPRAEDGVAEELRAALPAEKRQVRVPQVARTPAERQRVERDDDRGVAGGLRAADEARADLAVVTQ